MSILTHRTDKYNEKEELEKVKQRILLKYKDSNIDEKLKVFNQLCEFEYGRWLLINRGLNAYWANYLIYYNEFHNGEPKLHPLEEIMLKKSPGILASRERAVANRRIIENLLKDGIKISSIPCGMMNDLLRLDLKGHKSVKLVGIDLDPYAIKLAKENAKKFNKEQYCQFQIGDAWNLKIENEFDIIHSAGLNMYVNNENDLLSLYSNFYKAIKPGGFFIVSSNTPPMNENGKFIWNINKSEMDELSMQGLIFTEIIEVRQGLYCTENQIINQLKRVGFSSVEVDYDSRKMFLGFVARKN